MRSILLTSLMLVAMPSMADPVCEVAALTGEARVGVKLLVVGDKLDAGAEVRTGVKGRLRLRCVDGSSLVLGDATQLKLSEFTPAANGQLRKASLWLELGVIGQKVTSGGSWEVRTPSAVTAVRGTEFMVEVSGEQATAVHVKEGEVAVEAPSHTRGIAPRPVIKLDRDANGTQCTPRGGCVAAAHWSHDRVRELQDKLDF
ncbi:MAG: FecR domain-containing protein [Paucibacter sp.]|nr:FecR domain-containing protein [Roseateles sp.]